MRLIRLFDLLLRTLSRVLDRQCRSDDQHLTDAAQVVGFEHHSPEPRVDRQLREVAANRGQLAFGHAAFSRNDRGQLFEQRVAVTNH